MMSGHCFSHTIRRGPSLLAGILALLACPVHAGTTPTLELLKPGSSPSSTSRDTINFAARTDPGSSVTVNGQPAPIFSTGVFVRDLIPLKMGSNTVHVEIGSKDGSVLSTDVVVERTAERATAAHGLDDTDYYVRRALPTQALAVNPGEAVELGIPGPAGHHVQALWNGKWIDLAETSDPKRPESFYRATVTASPDQASGVDSPSSMMYRVVDQGKSAPPVVFESRGRLEVRNPYAPPELVQVKTGEKAEISFGLSDVRLGGPYLFLDPEGTVFRVSGRKGDDLRIALAPDFEGWVDESEVEPCPPGTPLPHLTFTSLSTSVTAEGDETVTIPYNSPVPFAVQDVPPDGPGSNPSIDIDLFSAHAAATWLIHKGTGNLISMVTMNQLATDRLRVTLKLKQHRLWGYKTERTTNSLKITVRHAPVISDWQHPLKGLTVAVEAGHGGSNQGAIGILGTKEKDITLQVSRVLQKELESAGAKVVQCRTSDVYLPFSKKIQPALDANADLFVAVHCNSGGDSHGLLGTGGTSTYYKYSFNHDLSEDVLRAVLHEDGLNSTGNVGNFNYHPIRMISWMPAILVEQAFISNPREEALLRAPAFQSKISRGIREGMERWLREEWLRQDRRK